MKTTFNYDEGTKITTCAIQIKDRIYTGATICHTEDLDMESTRIGEEIAYQRGLVKLLKDSKKFYMAEKKTLQTFRNSIGKCSYNKVLYKLDQEIAILEQDCTEIDNAVEVIKAQIKSYIDSKQGFQDKIRKMRTTEKTAE